MKDAEWIAQLGRCGLIEPSYIPNPEVMQLITVGYVLTNNVKPK